MEFPSNLKYSLDHEWLRPEGKTAYVGITDFAQHELGEIIYVDIPTVGETVDKGEVFGTVEAVKTVSDMLLPVTATVLEVNPKLDAQPELVNSDPYGEGWMVKIELTNPEELDELLSATDYQASI